MPGKVGDLISMKVHGEKSVPKHLHYWGAPPARMPVTTRTIPFFCGGDPK